MEFLSLLWSEVITKPMTNSLLLLYVFLGSNLGVAIIAFTVVVRGLTYPLVVRQLRQTRRLQSLQPRHQGNQREVQEQPSASWPGGHETVQRDGREPRGLSRPARHTDAHLHRALLGHQRRVALHPGEPRGPLQQALQLAALPGHRRPRQPGFPRHGPRARTHARGEHPRLYPRGALRVQHVRTTEDESGRLGRPDAAKHPTDDAVHVPRHVRDVQPLLPPRTCRLLGGFYVDRYRDAVFRHRLGRTLPADPIGLERRHSKTRAYLERSPAG